MVKRLLLLLIGAAGIVGAAPTFATTTLDYDAFLGDAKIGEAQITVQRSADRYQISGEARAVGVMELVTQWRSLFTAAGHVDSGHPVVQEFSLIERARNKIKEIFLSDGKVTYKKNGRTRAPRNPSDGLDLLSALFVDQDCDIGTVHNGKDSYRLRLRQRTELEVTAREGKPTVRCSFDVTDEDDEEIRAEVWLGPVGEMLVPLRLDIRGALEGSVRVSG
jgi:Protein of unknown function (DUF3108)